MKRFFLLCLLVIQSCGPTIENVKVNNRRHSRTQKSINKDAFKVITQDGKEFGLVFYDEHEKVLSSLELVYPVGAMEALMITSNGDDSVENVECITCCSHIYSVDLLESEEGTIKLTNFNLSNEKHKLKFYFSNGDTAIFD